MAHTDTTAEATAKSHMPPTHTGANRLAAGSAESMAKARAASAAAKAARKVSTLRKDFLDAPHWDDLARIYGVRLPPWGMPITVSAMRRWLRKVGLTSEWYREWSGEPKMDAFANRNPTWPLRAWAGLMLEERESADYKAQRASCSTT